MSTDRNIEDDSHIVETGLEIEGVEGPVDFSGLLAAGIIKQRQKDEYTVRLRCPGGRVPVKKLRVIADAAEKFGGDYVHLSFRQSVEIPYVKTGDLAELKEVLAAHGQEIATCGARIRVPTACSGCEYNPNGLTDTQGMAQFIDRECFGKPLPHKFKVAFSGCPIDCARTSEADLGFQGAIRPAWGEEACIGCRVCEAACLEGAIECDSDTGKPAYLADKCVYCGDCIRHCPTEAWRADTVGWIVRCGGKHGRHPAVGHVLAEFISNTEVFSTIEAVSNWYADRGEGKGRTRISTLLQEPELWADFADYMGKFLGPFMRRDAKPPTPVDLLL